MSARDANNRLSRRIREAQPVQDRLAPFRPAAHSELPRWPADAFNVSPRGLERVTIPPNGPSQLVCDSWPECQCEGDCNEAPRGLTEEQCILMIVLFALTVSGLGLIYLAVR